MIDVFMPTIINNILQLSMKKLCLARRFSFLYIMMVTS